MNSKVLIITSDLNLGTLLDARLAMESYETVFVQSGEAGLDQIHKNRPDLVLVDVTLSGISGYQTVQKIKMIPGNEALPFIVFSERENFRELFQDASIRAYMTKPVRPEPLLKQIRSILKTSGFEMLSERIKKKILIAGVEKYTLKKIKLFLESTGWQADISTHEDDTLADIQQSNPEILLLQFWDSLDIWDTAKILRDLHPLLTENKIHPVIFCETSLALEAKKTIPGRAIITFTQINDLLENINRHLTRLKT